MSIFASIWRRVHLILPGEGTLGRLVLSGVVVNPARLNVRGVMPHNLFATPIESHPHRCQNTAMTLNSVDDRHARRSGRASQSAQPTPKHQANGVMAQRDLGCISRLLTTTTDITRVYR